MSEGAAFTIMVIVISISCAIVGAGVVVMAMLWLT